MENLDWSKPEKAIARRVFDAALERELADFLRDFKTRAAAAQDLDDVWALHAQMDRWRKDLDNRFDYRYSQLPLLFGLLLREGRIRDDELVGLGPDKLDVIRRIASG